MTPDKCQLDWAGWVCKGLVVRGWVNRLCRAPCCDGLGRDDVPLVEKYRTLMNPSGLWHLPYGQPPLW